MRYLLDTDWIIKLLVGEKTATEKIQQLNPEEIVISLVTVAEIYESAYNYANPEAHIQQFRTFITNFQHLSLNLPIIEKFAEVRSYLRRRGEIISDFDIVLAATALHYDLIVVTFNKKHFARIPDLKIH